VKLVVVAVQVAMALDACDGEKVERRTTIAHERNPWRSARENSGGEAGRTAAAAGGRKLGFFLSKEKARREESDI
jgi:hypothetical protein